MQFGLLMQYHTVSLRMVDADPGVGDEHISIQVKGEKLHEGA